MIRVVNGEAVAIICRAGSQRSRHCVGCRRLLKDHWKLCDFPVRPGKMCDAVLCQSCATHKEPDTDYCPKHAALLTPEGRLKL